MHGDLERVYYVKINGEVTEPMQDAMREGLHADDARKGGHSSSTIHSMDFAPFVNYRVIKSRPNFSTLKVTIREGKNRELRRFFGYFDVEVVDLKRVSYGIIDLGMLKPGKTRFLEPGEYKALRDYLAYVQEKMIDNLALKLRPKCLEELAGQKHLSSKNSPFYKLLKSGTIPHSIFFGPAGVGKTTLARIVSSELELPFYELDATSVKVDEFRKIFANHRNALSKPLIFIDEVHRLSKTQQEVLLLPMENKEAIIIGASTENPYFTLSSGIRSRSMLFEFFPLSDEDLEEVIQRAKQIVEFSIDDEASAYLLNSSAGDSRSLLNLLEFAIKVSSHVSLIS